MSTNSQTTEKLKGLLAYFPAENTAELFGMNRCGTSELSRFKIGPYTPSTKPGLWKRFTVWVRYSEPVYRVTNAIKALRGVGYDE